MIKVIIKLTETNLKLKREFMLPVLPNVGDQFFLDDFMDAEEQKYIRSFGEKVNGDQFFVDSRLWMFNEEFEEVYVEIWLTERVN